jgi:hypothetical protein
MRKFYLLSAFLMMATLAGAPAALADPLLDPDQDPFSEIGEDDHEVGEEMCAWPR